MIAIYSVRLAILCFASFFVLHLIFGLLSLKLCARCACISASISPQWGSRIFIALRLAPASLSLLTISCVCIPSYLRYEENSVPEEIGLLSLALACLGLLIFLTAFARASRAVIQSSWLSNKLAVTKPAQSWYLNLGVEKFPPLGLIGLLRPRVVVSPRVLEALTTEEFQVVLEHERAHLSSGDNLKRLLILLCPGLFPFVRSFNAIEDHWQRYAELSADDFATRSQPGRSIVLAEALIKLARLEGNQTAPPLVSGLFAACDGLALRVERLLRLEPATEQPALFWRSLWVASCLLLACSAFLLPQLSLWRGVYPLLESLLR